MAVNSARITIDDREIADLVKKLYEFEHQFVKRLEDKTIMRKAAKIVVDKEKQESPVKTGRLKRSFRVLPLKTKMSVIVGPSYKGDDSGKHAHLVEYGFITRSGQRYPGKPFIKSTYEMTKYDVKNYLIREIDKLIEAELRKI